MGDKRAQMCGEGCFFFFFEGKRVLEGKTTFCKAKINNAVKANQRVEGYQTALKVLCLQAT